MSYLLILKNKRRAGSSGFITLFAIGSSSYRRSLLATRTGLLFLTHKQIHTDTCVRFVFISLFIVWRFIISMFLIFVSLSVCLCIRVVPFFFFLSSFFSFLYFLLSLERDNNGKRTHETGLCVVGRAVGICIRERFCSASRTTFNALSRENTESTGTDESSSLNNHVCQGNLERRIVTTDETRGWMTIYKQLWSSTREGFLWTISSVCNYKTTSLYGAINVVI